ncbi:MAG TPA: TRZ/ATZ family hydrolase [Burkholderiaceae bacterium]|jgi:5-methylthioadenosine/S-adenosylhomocysteine deaminase|nr:TRZ/ATZ family hydrolase [Burkholderiaceae bacterium]
MELIAPQWIAPVEPASTVLHDHAVAIEGERIVAVLPAAQARQAWPDARVTELPGHLLVPGFVNLHTHVPMTLLRGAGDDLPLERWLHERIWPLEAALISPEFVADGAVLACAEMLLGGITCFQDMYFFPEEVARAALDIGMRAAVGIIVIEFGSAYGSGPGEYIRKGLELRDQMRDEPRISFTLAPHAPYTVSDDSFRRVASLAAELGMPVQCHVHETLTEISDSMAQHGRRPLRRLADLGLLGPEFIAIHSVHLDDADLSLLASHGATVAHCPHSNLKLASGIAPTTRMRAAGIPVGIGTDGAASNNRLDLLAEARTASLLAKGSSGDATAWTAHETLHAMTLAGARALGLGDRLGSIVAGKQADLVAIDLSEPGTLPVFEPVAHLIYTAGREQVKRVWVAGKAVVSERQLAGQPAVSRLGEVVARTRLWHNRLVETLPAGLRLSGA